MQKSAPLRYRVMCLALATFGTLLLLPATRSLFRTQLQVEAMVYAGTDVSEERDFASRVPNDYPVQLALATEIPPSSQESMATQDSRALSVARNRRIEALEQRFPNNPSVYANLLRYMTLDEMCLWRDNGPDASPAGKQTSLQTSPEAIARFVATAQKGADLDPDNAYFPMMQAVGLFTARRDAEALEAIRRASRYGHWKEYYLDDLHGHERLLNAASGEQESVRRMRMIYDLQFPQYAQLSAAARAAAHLAAEAERTGKVEEGIAIRHALMRSGGLMRAQSTSIIGPLVGMAITEIGTYRPGGVQEAPHPWIDKSDRRTLRQKRSERCKRYCAYLESQGATSEAAWVKAEIAAGDVAKAILLQGVENPVYSGLTQIQFCVSWLINLVLLLSAATLFYLSATAHYARLLRPKKGWETKYLPALRCLYALIVIGGICLWQGMVVSDGTGPCLAVAALFSAPLSPRSTAALQGVVLGLSLLVPVLLVGLIAAVTRSQRIPLATGLGRGLRGTAIPAAAALFLLYGVSLLPTIYFQSVIQKDFLRFIPNEPHYFAEITGKVWPGDPQP